MNIPQTRHTVWDTLRLVRLLPATLALLVASSQAPAPTTVSNTLEAQYQSQNAQSIFQTDCPNHLPIFVRTAQGLDPNNPRLEC